MKTTEYFIASPSKRFLNMVQIFSWTKTGNGGHHTLLKDLNFTAFLTSLKLLHSKNPTIICPCLSFLLENRKLLEKYYAKEQLNLFLSTHSELGVVLLFISH